MYVFMHAEIDYDHALGTTQNYCKYITFVLLQ